MNPSDIAPILEAIMIISFGCSWPLNILKSLQTRSTKGKSLPFLLLIDFGYVAGIVGKLLVCDQLGFKWWVFAFYVLNFVMVSIDLCLYFKHLRAEKKAAKQAK